VFREFADWFNGDDLEQAGNALDGQAKTQRPCRTLERIGLGCDFLGEAFGDELLNGFFVEEAHGVLLRVAAAVQHGQRWRDFVDVDEDDDPGANERQGDDGDEAVNHLRSLRTMREKSDLCSSENVATAGDQAPSSASSS